MRDLVIKNLRACQLAALATLGLQLLALLVSCSLYYAESRPRLEYRVLQQLDYDTASQSSYPPAAPGGVSAGTARSGGHGLAHGHGHASGVVAGRPDAWSRRIHDKYGAGAVGGDPSGFGYDPELGRLQARGDDDEADRNTGKCSIM
jgi:hypothetical protein